MTNEAIVQKITEHDQRLTTVEKDQDEMKSELKELKEISNNTNMLAVEMKHMRETTDTQLANLNTSVAEVKSGQNNLSKELTDLKNAKDKETAQAARKILWIAVGAIASGCIGFLLAQAFPNIFK